MGTARQLGRLALRGGLVLLLLLGATAREGLSDPEPKGGAVEVQRLVLGLYNAGEPIRDPAGENPLSLMVEMPLNWLGQTLRVWDVAEGPPPAALLDEAHAIITWFEAVKQVPAWVVPWLEQHGPGASRRVVHLETLPGEGRGEGGQFAARSATYLERLGLAWSPKYAEGTARVKVEFIDDKLCALERNPRLGAAFRGLTHTTAEGTAPEGVREWVVTRDRLVPDEPVVPVLTGPWGGIALHPYVMKIGAGDGGRRWHLDLFAFLREALGLADDPVPAPQVAFGRRVFLFHLDGDGFESRSVVGQGAYCGEVMRDAVLKRFKIPMTMSVIVGSLTTTIEPTEANERMALARTIFSLPHVEGASHGVLHPYDWFKPWGPTVEQLANFGFPRLDGFTYTPANEVGESLDFIQQWLMPEGKRMKVMLWTGHCLPPPEAIAAARTRDCWNLNGGTYRWDAANDSVGFVSPLGRYVDGEFQVYAGAANDNEYPGFFDNNPGAFGHVDTTIERTGKGRILKPANIYAHFYSAERHVRLDTLARLVERWAEAEPTIPLFVSQYAAAAHESRAARILRTKEGWQLRGWGACRTARLDAPGQYVDFARSRGVVAANRLEGRLFVTLAGPEADLVLRKTPGDRPYIETSDHWLEDVRLSPSGVAFTSRAWRTRGIVLAGFPPSTDLQARAGSEVLALRSDAEGRVRLALPPEAGTAVEVSVP